MQMIQGKQPRPWRVLLYGTPGIGKSTFAKYAPGAGFIDLEDGLSNIDCYRTPHLKTYKEFMEGMRGLYRDPRCQTVVIDTADALEKILTYKLLSEAPGNKISLNDFGWGKGWDKLVGEWNRILDMIDKFNEGGKNVLIIGHEQVKKFEDPTSDGYDRYQIQVHKRSSEVIFNRMDAVIFARYETFVKGGADEKKKAKGTGKRILCCIETPAQMAKNRFDLGAAVPMDKPDQVTAANAFFNTLSS